MLSFPQQQLCAVVAARLCHLWRSTIELTEIRRAGPPGVESVNSDHVASLCLVVCTILSPTYCEPAAA